MFTVTKHQRKNRPHSSSAMEEEASLSERYPKTGPRDTHARSTRPVDVQPTTAERLSRLPAVAFKKFKSRIGHGAEHESAVPARARVAARFPFTAVHTKERRREPEKRASTNAPTKELIGVSTFVTEGRKADQLTGEIGTLSSR